MTIDEQGDFEVRVKARDRITSFVYHYHPLDVVGSDGHLWPYASNIADFEPATGRVQQPPPVPRVKESPVAFECVLQQIVTINKGRGDGSAVYWRG